MPVHQYFTRRATAFRNTQNSVHLQPPILTHKFQDKECIYSHSPSNTHSSNLSEMKESEIDHQQNLWTSRKRLRNDFDSDDKDEKEQRNDDKDDDTDSDSLFAEPLSPLLSSEPSSPLPFSSLSLSLANSPRSYASSPYPSNSTSAASSARLSDEISPNDSASSSSYASYFDHDQSLSQPQPRKRPRLYIHIPEEDSAPSTWTQKYPAMAMPFEFEKKEKKIEFAGLPCFDDVEEAEEKKNDAETATIGRYSLKDYQDPHDSERMEAEQHLFPCSASTDDATGAPLICNTPPIGAASISSCDSNSNSSSSSSTSINDVFSQYYDWAYAAAFPPVDLQLSPLVKEFASAASISTSSSSSLSSSFSVASSSSSASLPLNGFEVNCSESDGIEHHSWRKKDAKLE